jgi:hypothetical protein
MSGASMPRNTSERALYFQTAFKDIKSRFTQGSKDLAALGYGPDTVSPWFHYRCRWADNRKVSTHVFPIPHEASAYSSLAVQQAQDLQDFNGAIPFLPSNVPFEGSIDALDNDPDIGVSV